MLIGNEITYSLSAQCGPGAFVKVIKKQTIIRIRIFSGFAEFSSNILRNINHSLINFIL